MISEGFKKVLEKVSIQTDVSSSFYDTANLCLLKNSNWIDLNSLAQWFIDNQYEDGSWGSQFFFREDRLINTLAILNFFKKTGKNFDGVNKAEFFCKKEVVKYADSLTRPVAFELTFPNLWYQVFSTNYLPSELEILLKKSKEKIKKIPLEKVFSTHTTLLHSLEVFIDKTVPWGAIERLRSESGNIGNSPSSVIAYLSASNDDKSEVFLKNLFMSQLGSLPVNYPLDIFERNWILYFAYKMNISLPEEYYSAFSSYLVKNWSNNGITWSKDFSIPDIDDTSVTWILLKDRLNSNVFEVFSQFVKDDTNSVRCFPGEIEPSPSHLAHFVEAVGNENQFAKSVSNSLKEIIDLQTEEGYWLDKWHVSPYYSASQVILSCHSYIPNAVKKSLNWIVSSQREDGGWGLAFSTSEETSYAVIALIYAQREGLIKAQDSLEKAKQFFSKHTEDRLVELWIDKNLYCPYSIVKAVLEIAKISL